MAGTQLAVGGPEAVGEIAGSGGGVLIRKAILSIWLWQPQSKFGIITIKTVTYLHLIIVIVFGLYCLIYILAQFLSYGLPPCTRDDLLFYTGAIGFISSLLTFPISAYTLLKANWHYVLLAASLTTLCAAIHFFAVAENDRRQQACASWTLDEAMENCGANNDVIRRKRVKSETDDYSVLTLTAPGTTDEAWACLWSYSNWGKGIGGMQIDESVYEQYRSKTK